MKRDAGKDLKVNQLNNDGKRRKKQKEQKTGSEIWWSALQSHLAAPPRSVLSSALFVSDEWEMLQGESWVSGSWMTRDKTKPRLCSAETPCCTGGVLWVRKDLDLSGLVSLALFQWGIQRARWSVLKKKKNYTKLHFQCSHLTEGMGSYPEAGFASGQIAANCSQCLPSAPVLVYWLVYWAAYLAHSFSLSTGTHTDDTPASQCPLQCALNSTAL